MKDQVDALVGNGVPAACSTARSPSDEKSAVASGAARRAVRLLYVAPERWSATAATASSTLLSSRPISFVAVDEAHCISQWGHDFRPEYRQLGAAARALAGVGMHAYTATATERVRHDIVGAAGAARCRSSSSARSTGRTWCTACWRASTLKRADPRRARPPRGEAGIIYCTSRKEVDATGAVAARTPAVRARPYHAGLADDERHRNQDAFLERRGRRDRRHRRVRHGHRRSDVRFVIHAGAPKSLEHYQQETGRAGRDGLEAECVLSASGADFVKWRMMLEKNGELRTRAARCCATSSATRRASAAATGPSSSYFGETLHQGQLRRLRLLSRRARERGRAGRPGAQDSVVRRACRPALRRRARDQRAARQRQRAGPVRGHHELRDVRPDARTRRSTRCAATSISCSRTACCSRRDDEYPGPADHQ